MPFRKMLEQSSQKPVGQEDVNVSPYSACPCIKPGSKILALNKMNQERKALALQGRTHSGRRELALKSCPLTPTQTHRRNALTHNTRSYTCRDTLTYTIPTHTHAETLTHTHTHTHAHTHVETHSHNHTLIHTHTYTLTHS